MRYGVIRGGEAGAQAGDEQVQRLFQGVRVQLRGGGALGRARGAGPGRIRGGDFAERHFQAVDGLGFGFGLGHAVILIGFSQARGGFKVKCMIHKAVIVHGLEDAQAALAPGLPVTLLSAPGAALIGGCLWWRALMRAAGVKGVSLLDCADAPGRALEALRLGLPGIVFTGEASARDVIATVAARTGAVVLETAPTALDLAARGAARRLLAWLG